MEFYTILTNIGKAKLANAQVMGKTVDLVEMAVGDGNGDYYEPTESQEELINEVWRGNINQITNDSENPNWIVIETVIPTNDGGFTIREVGVFDDDGDMIAIGKYPETYKPVLSEGVGKELCVRMILEVSNASSVTLKIDPAVVLASRAYVDDKMKNIEDKVNKKIDVLDDASLIITVGVNGDFETINEALTYLSKKHPSNNNKTVINLKSGFVMAEQVIVEGIDLGWITIVSEDEEVIIKREALTKSVTEPGSYPSVPHRKDRPAFCAKNFGVLPIIGTLFVMDNSGPPYDREERQLYEGVMAYINSRARVLPGCGFKNVSGRACFAWRNSRIDCERAIFTNATDRGIDAARGSTIVAEGAICDYCGEYGIRAFAGSWVHCRSASIKYCEGDGISVQTGIVNAEHCDISFAGNRGISCSNASNVSASNAIIKDCGSDGIWANRGSYVDANQVDASGAGGYGFHVNRGSIIAAQSAIGTTNQPPLELTRNGIIFQ